MDIFGKDSMRTVNNAKSSETKLAQATRRLSSGYRINSAADDAAGLAISEKLRSIDRGIRQGMRNITDGINYIDTVDGASQEIHNMLHRMKELAVESANGTYSNLDRKALDLEYQQLIDEIGQIADSAEFNGIPLFERHFPEYEKNEGVVVHNEPITIDGSNNTLVLGYTIDGQQREFTVDIPNGTYGVDELADAIDTILFNGVDSLIIGVNTENQFTMQCEGGKIDYISGSASSLFYDTVIGSSDGYLLGVTSFSNDTTARLEVIAGKNDVISFRLGNNDDTLYSITLDKAMFTRPELVEHINQKLEAAGLPCNVEAVMYTNSEGKKVIGLKSEQTITGLAGNFLMIDGGSTLIHSPIYDICCYSTLVNSEATLTGTKQVSAGVEIERGRNDYFVLDASWYTGDGLSKTEKLRIDLLDPGENLRTYSSGDQLISRISEQLEALDCPIQAELTDNGELKFSTLQYGKECKIKLDTSDVPSSYMVYDLFDRSTLSVLTPWNTVSDYTKACFNAKKPLSNSIVIPNAHNSLSFTVGIEGADGSVIEHTLDFDITPGTYTQAQLNTHLNNLLATNYPDLSDKLFFSVGSTLTFSANGIDGSDVTSITANSSSAYSRLIYGPVYYDSIDTSHAVGTEKDLISYGSTVPGTGRPNVTSTAGKTETAVTYTTVSNPSGSQRSEAYLSYYQVTPGIVEGDSINTGHEGAVNDDDYIYKPATMTLPNVLTQFSAAGTSQRDTNLSFKISDRDGNTTAYNVNIPKGSTAAQAITLLNQQLNGAATVTSNGNDLVFTSVNTGKKVTFSDVSGTLKFRAEKSSLASDPQAVVDIDNNRVYKPASLTLSAAGSHIPLTVGADNDKFKFTAGGHSYDLTLSHGTYTSLSDIANELNARISEKDGGSPASSVSVSGSSLVITGPLKESGSITVDSSSTCKLQLKKNVNDVASSPYYNPATGNAEIPANIRAEGIDSHFPLSVDSSSNTITMDYTCPNPSSPGSTITETLTITVPDGNYNNAQQLTNAINSAISADPALSGKIIAAYSSSGSNKGLTFTTEKGGAGYALSNLGGTMKVNQYKTTNSSSGGSADPIANKIKYPAYISNSQFSTLFNGEGVEINDLNNFVSLKINGVDYKFAVPAGEYSGSSGQSALLAELQNGLSGAGVTVTADGGTIKITTDAVGTAASISLNPDNTAPYFMRAQNCSAPQQINRSSQPCQIVGRTTISSITIEDYFSEMKFTYTEGGNSIEVNVSVPSGTYNANQLAAAIQASIDASSVPPGSLVVGVSGGKLTITGADISDTRGISNFSGRLFDRVFQDPRYTSVTHHSEKAGTTTGSAVSYIIGRNDLQPETPEELDSGKNVIIYAGLNDTLIFDLTYQGKSYKVDCRIPAGEYLPEELAEAVQNAGRSSLSGMTDINGDPLPADYFHATIGLGAIGLSDSGNTAISSNDKLILSFVLPDNGTIKNSDTIIDGVRGNSAYRVFYDATQSPRPSRVIGKADLSNGINIQEGFNDTMSLKIDGTNIKVTIPGGAYTCESISEELNRQYEALGCIVRTAETNGHLMFYTTENGAYDIGKLSGSAADSLFYGVDKRDDDVEIGIHTGRRTDSYIWCNKTRADDHLMRINTTGVTTVKRALKAIDRLDYANNYLLKWRALSGAIHNRAEYTYERNQIYSQNLQASESGIRDADIPSENARAAKEKMIMQAQMYILSKQKENQASILDTLA